MDELAEAVGVSRRTLFNDVGDKVSAVLGPYDPATEHTAALMRTYDRSIPLLSRGVMAMSTCLENSGLTAEDYELVGLMTRAVTSEPKLTHTISGRIAGVVQYLTDAAVDIEGWAPSDPRARMFGHTLVMIVNDAFLASSRAFGEGRTDHNVVVALHDYEKALRAL